MTCECVQAWKERAESAEAQSFFERHPKSTRVVGTVEP